LSIFTIQPGQTVTVAIGPGATEPGFAYAGEQLRAYLARVLGRPVVLTAVEQATILIARDGHRPDEHYRFGVDPSGERLTIHAGGGLAAGFAVFAFLRQACGCVFAGLAPDGEWIPARASLRWDVPTEPRCPRLRYRGMQFTTLEPRERQAARLDWMVKNGLNRAMVRFTPDEECFDEVDPQTGVRHGPMGSEGPRMSAADVERDLLPLIEQRGLRVDVSHHNLRCWLPPARYRDEHPEWFALINGQRGHDLRQLCLCTSNPQAVDALIARLDAYLREHPRVERIGVVPEDGMGMCQCEACVAMDDDPGDATRAWQGPLHPSANNASKARRYARLLNAVADALRPRHPRVTVVGAAYVDLAHPAPDVTLADNIEMWLAIYWRDGARPLTGDSPSAINRLFRRLIEQWSALLPGRVYLYEYYMGMNAQHSLPYPMSPVIADDWRELGGLVSGATVQCLTSLHETYGLNLLTFARAGWQPSVDHDAVLDDWLLGMFGHAADAVRPIVQRWLDAVVDIARGQIPAEIAGFLDEGMLKPDARNIVVLMAQMPEAWLAGQIAEARAAARLPRERRQIDRFEHMLNYCHACVRLERVTADERAAAAQVEQALADVLTRLRHPLSEGWIAPAHAQRWQRLAQRRMTLELTR
jgi:hypothetical protein